MSSVLVSGHKKKLICGLIKSVPSGRDEMTHPAAAKIRRHLLKCSSKSDGKQTICLVDAKIPSQGFTDTNLLYISQLDVGKHHFAIHKEHRIPKLPYEFTLAIILQRNINLRVYQPIVTQLNT